MTNSITVTGRLTGPTTVELDQPILNPAMGLVEVVVPVLTDQARVHNFSDLPCHLRSLAPGQRACDEIEQQMQVERSSWV